MSPPSAMVDAIQCEKPSGRSMNPPKLPKPPVQQAAQQPKPIGGISFMAEENDYEPDSPECRLTDNFIDALMFCDGPAAAAALRELKELDGEALGRLAWL